MQEKPRKEISSVIGDVENFNMEQLNDLIYTNYFIKESLWLFIPTPQNARVATKDWKFGNVSIPKGTTILIPKLYIHKNEFQQREEFIPERWLKDIFYFLIVTVYHFIFRI